MSIQIPGYLQWVSYLVGSEWPQGDEDAMFRIGDHWRSNSYQMTGIVPELNRMRQSTRAVLQGMTAGAADKQFSLLFDGDASVEKLAKAMAALGDLSDGTGRNIEYSKLQILTSLAIAAFEIAYALAQSAVTAGASTLEIPVIEGFTMASIRQVTSYLMKRILVDLSNTLKDTAVKQILKKSLIKTAEGSGQEVFIQLVQHANGHQQNFNWTQLEHVVVIPAQHLLGDFAMANFLPLVISQHGNHHATAECDQSQLQISH